MLSSRTENPGRWPGLRERGPSARKTPSPEGAGFLSPGQRPGFSGENLSNRRSLGVGDRYGALVRVEVLRRVEADGLQVGVEQVARPHLAIGHGGAVGARLADDGAALD